MFSSHTCTTGKSFKVKVQACCKSFNIIIFNYMQEVWSMVCRCTCTWYLPTPLYCTVFLVSSFSTHSGMILVSPVLSYEYFTCWAHWNSLTCVILWTFHMLSTLKQSHLCRPMNISHAEHTETSNGIGFVHKLFTPMLLQFSSVWLGGLLYTLKGDSNEHKWHWPNSSLVHDDLL